MYKRILVATDGSQLSGKAVQHAIRLASAVDCALVALHVIPRYPTSYLEDAVGISRREMDRTEGTWKAHGQEMVDAVQATAQTEGVKAKGLVVKSNEIADAVIRTAAKEKCDLIVMASHGRKGLKRILLGSETQHVLTHGSIPTLIVR